MKKCLKYPAARVWLSAVLAMLGIGVSVGTFQFLGIRQHGELVVGLCDASALMAYTMMVFIVERWETLPVTMASNLISISSGAIAVFGAFGLVSVEVAAIFVGALSLFAVAVAFLQTLDGQPFSSWFAALWQPIGSIAFPVVCLLMCRQKKSGAARESGLVPDNVTRLPTPSSSDKEDDEGKPGLSIGHATKSRLGRR